MKNNKSLLKYQIYRSLNNLNNSLLKAKTAAVSMANFSFTFLKSNLVI